MVLPNNKPSWDFKELVDAMKQLGWKRVMRRKQVIIEGSGRIMLSEYLFDVRNNLNIKCPIVGCSSRDLFFVKREGQGNFVACAEHRAVQSLPFEFGILLDQYEIDFDSAEALINGVEHVAKPAAWNMLVRNRRPYVRR